MQPKKRALITGLSGQDGIYLAALLAQNGYQVYGIVRHERADIHQRLAFAGFMGSIEFITANLLEQAVMSDLMRKLQPDECYHLASESSVAQSLVHPDHCLQFNHVSTLNLLTAILEHSSKTRLFFASSGEVFGIPEHLPAVETTSLAPCNPYGLSKSLGQQLCQYYRQHYGLFISCGILFLHESALRGQYFFVKKIITEALKIQQGHQAVLKVGNLQVARDFGYAPDYVQAMWRMLQHTEPDDFILASGKATTLQAIVDQVFTNLQISKDRLLVDPALYRPTEAAVLYGNPQKIHQQLQWRSDLSLSQLVDRLIEDEIRYQTSTTTLS
jgi:GDPmannose 4,6-dehydratase